MKKSLLIASAILSFNFVDSQTTAQDWTLTDCSSNSHTLFDILNNENVVVMEFAMGCSSCGVAATSLMNLKTSYASSHPGRVKFFYMDYWTGNDCVNEVLPFVATYNFDASFDNTSSQKNYYMSGSPMPAIVIVAGSNHSVIYEKNSYSSGDVATITNAIDNFFATIGVDENVSLSSFNVYPNPTDNNLNLSIELVNNDNNVQIEILDITGKVVYTKSNIQFVEGVNNFNVETETLESGNYFLRLTTNDKVYNKGFNKI